ncbi:MAG: diguanylate cyclase, partial [Candidatus Omnitrophica bacterium]|nr:diguanylate cyclase [Candidatus Omnitrophota bacterium]
PVFEGDEVIQVLTAIRDITSRKQIDQELRFLSEIARNMSEGVNLISLKDGSILYTNNKFDEMFGYVQGELIGKHASILNASYGKNAGDFAKEITVALEKDGLWKGEICNIKKDGTSFWGFASVSVFEHPKYGKVAVSVHTNITDQKQKSKELKISEEKYRFIFEKSRIFAIVMDKDYKLKDINECSLEVLGYSGEEILGRNCLDFVVPEDRKKVIENITNIMAGEESPEVEINIYAKDKSVHAILFSQGQQFIFSETGEAEGVLFTGVDITERKRVERQQSSVTTGLRAVLEAADKLIACPDIDTVFKRAIEFARERFGLERCAIFIEENGSVRGIYGTDRYGRTTDERSLKFEKNEVWKRRLKMLDARDPNWFVVREPQLEWDGRSSVKIGEGWIAVTPIQSAHRPIGVFVNDSAISGSVLDPMKQDTLAVFCSLIGNVIERKRAEQKLEVVNKRLLQTSRRFKQLSLRDSHTGLFNHRYLVEIIESEFNRAKRYGFSLSYIMLDLDYFKSVNDVYGHQFGDLILKQFARHLKQIVRQYDILVRFGGEEFVIISPGIDRETALVLSQRILNSVYLKSFGNDEHSVKLKLSIAVSSFPEDNVNSGMDLVNMADKVLNKAKEDGGDRVYCFEDTKKSKMELMQTTNGHNNIQFLQEKLDKLTKRANQSLIESIFAFAKTIKLKDNYTGEHVENTVYFAGELAKKLGLPENKIEQVKQAAQLHDLGKIGVSDKILLKKTKLSKSEFEEIKKHPMIAADILRPIQFLQDIIPSILYHHERWDGKGYPFGLKGEEIPIGARIVAISDVYHALISDRPYRPAFSKAQATKLIKAGAGTQFDPKIVDVFLALS